MSYKETVAAKTEDFTTSTVVDSIKTESPSRGHTHQPPAHLLKEIETLKIEKDKYEKENQSIVSQNQEIVRSLENKSEEIKSLEQRLEETSKELKEVGKLRADAANAKLAVDKVTLEKENLSKIVE